MTGLWTNDRNTLAEALLGRRCEDHGLPKEAPPGYWRCTSPGCLRAGDCSATAAYLIDSGAVRVLDHEDTGLRKQVAEAVWHAVPAADRTVDFWKRLDDIARAAIVALRQP
jgi:hypothetical protein